MRYGEDSTVGEFRTDGVLDQVVSFQIDGSRGFVKDEDFSFMQQRTSQTN